MLIADTTNATTSDINYEGCKVPLTTSAILATTSSDINYEGCKALENEYLKTQDTRQILTMRDVKVARLSL